jgi:hypothetical protein
VTVKKSGATDSAKPKRLMGDACHEKAKPRRVMPGLRGAHRSFAIDEERVAAGVPRY